MLVAALVGGLIGAGLLFAAYFLGVALVGAGLGAVVANLLFSAGGRDPQLLVVVLCAIAGAVGRCTSSATSSSSAPASAARGR